jgi:hypothetical protein
MSSENPGAGRLTGALNTISNQGYSYAKDTSTAPCPSCGAPPILPNRKERRRGVTGSVAFHALWCSFGGGADRLPSDKYRRPA